MTLNRCFLFLSVATAALAQVGSRGIVPEAVIQARPAPKPGAPAAKPKYQPNGEDALKSLRQGAGATRQVGVTIWRLRPGTSSDSGARILVQEDSVTTEWIPERVAGTTGLRAGDRVRMTIESPDTGYLYVIDRERYASGERGAPYLIFPTKRTRGGDNRVKGGKLIDIPSQEDRPNFFSLRLGRPDQVEEELTILLTNEPLAGVEIGAKAVALTNEQVAQWENQWGAGRVERFDLSNGEGKAWTRAEQIAASSSTRLLMQDDPPPQTVYSVGVKSGDPLFVKVRLKYTR